jgi:uncharacterized membrane protein
MLDSPFATATATYQIDGSTSYAAENSAAKIRLTSIDTLRGLVMVLMALDHVRDYFSNVHQGLLDPTTTTVSLYVTRWITHLCAPTFILLAGTSAYLQTRKSPLSQVSRFLVLRGLWLIFLELTVLAFAWTYNFHFLHSVYLQVIWAIGVSMIALAAVIRLSPKTIGVIAAIMIAGHNLLDGIEPFAFGTWAPLWNLLHVRGQASFGDIVYPVIPWIGVMMLGYSLGPIFTFGAEGRRALLIYLGLGALAAFIILRLLNNYGDPHAWQSGTTLTATLMYFMDVAKYPPSLLYLLATLGIALLLLAAFESRHWLANLSALEVFGRVPLFFYVLHIALAHLLAGLLAWSLGWGTVILTSRYNYYPADWGISLGWVYVAWACVLLILYPACRWFSRIKRTRTDWWLSYF